MQRTTSGLRAYARRLAAVSAVTGLTLLLSPATAVAAGPADVNPLLNCVTKHPNGSWTAVLGYDNTSGSRMVIRGSDNKVTPGKYADELPTTFEAGLRNGAFSITFPKGNGATWRLGDDSLWITSDGAAACPPSTQMPGEGNGLGPVVGLAVAGVLGAVVLRRVRRLAAAPVPAPAPEPERVSTDA
jgi:hypothetical protein